MHGVRQVVWIVGLGTVLGASVSNTAPAAEAAAGRRTSDLDGDSPPATLADVAWLEGRWSGTGLGGAVEEIWTRPGEGVLCGMFTSVKAGAVAFHELFTILEVNGSLVLLIKHFGPDLTGWEAREEALRFPLVRIEDDAVHFAGLTYRREGDDRLRAWVLVDGAGDAAKEAAFDFTRVW